MAVAAVANAVARMATTAAPAVKVVRARAVAAAVSAPVKDAPHVMAKPVPMAAHSATENAAPKVTTAHPVKAVKEAGAAAMQKHAQ